VSPIGHALKSERLKSWANQELNGYSDGETVDSVRELIRVDDYSRKILMDFVSKYRERYVNRILRGMVVA
jgi:hypothetical protein